MENIEKPKMKVDLTQAPWMECSEGGKTFTTRVLFKKISPIISPTGKEEFIPIEVIICDKCGKVPKFYYEKAKDIPDDVKSSCEF